MIPRRKFHHVVFLLAGTYNIIWGIYSALCPQWLFQFTGMPLQNHPEIFSCMAMVIGLYGLLYLYVAWHPEDGFHLALVGLGGKILGPLGMIYLIASGKWPLSASIMCLTNDLIWWIPFSIYLSDAWPFFKSKAKF